MRSGPKPTYQPYVSASYPGHTFSYTEREVEVAQKRLSGTLSFHAVGSSLGLSTPRTQQVLKKALRRSRHHLYRLGLRQEDLSDEAVARFVLTLTPVPQETP